MMLIPACQLGVLQIDLNFIRHLCIDVFATETCDDTYDPKSE